jgi:hypothetical protein
MVLLINSIGCDGAHAALQQFEGRHHMIDNNDSPPPLEAVGTSKMNDEHVIVKSAASSSSSSPTSWSCPVHNPLDILQDDRDIMLHDWPNRCVH